MKNLSKLIKENSELKLYKYQLDILYEGHVTASSEGDAGELLDEIVNELDSTIDSSKNKMINYSILNIEELGNSPIIENLESSDEIPFFEIRDNGSYVAHCTKDTEGNYYTYGQLGINQFDSCEDLFIYLINDFSELLNNNVFFN